MIWYYTDIVSGNNNIINKPVVYINIFPNPASGYIQMSYNSPIEEPVSIVLFDISGNKTLNLFELKPGDENRGLYKNISEESIHAGTYL